MVDEIEDLRVKGFTVTFKDKAVEIRLKLYNKVRFANQLKY